MGYNPVKLQLQNGEPTIKFGHADGFSRLISKYKELQEDTVIASLQSEVELKTTLCNTARKIPLMLDQINQEALHDEYIN